MEPGECLFKSLGRFFCAAGATTHRKALKNEMPAHACRPQAAGSLSISAVGTIVASPIRMAGC